LIREEIFEQAAEKLHLNLGESLDPEGKSFFIEKGQKRRLVITDIHGSFQSFIKLLDKIQLKKKDQLFILGDMINRAPYSLYVIERIAEMIVSGYRVFPLRGNHEQLFLDFAGSDKKKLRALASRQYSSHLLEDGELPYGIARFFEALPYYFETDEYFLVHAGFDTGKKDPLSSWSDMLWIRSFPYVSAKLKSKRVVHGHVPTGFSSIKKSIKNGKPEIRLDNGCIRAGVAGFGKLLCWDLDSHELFAQNNIDFLPA